MLPTFSVRCLVFADTVLELLRYLRGTESALTSTEPCTDLAGLQKGLSYHVYLCLEKDMMDVH